MFLFTCTCYKFLCHVSWVYEYRTPYVSYIWAQSIIGFLIDWILELYIVPFCCYIFWRKQFHEIYPQCFVISCFYDYVELRDGATSDANSLAKLCGNTRPSTEHSTGSTMYLRFRTDNSITHKGFKAKYSIGECVTGTESTHSATLSSTVSHTLPHSLKYTSPPTENMNPFSGYVTVSNISQKADVFRCLFYKIQEILGMTRISIWVFFCLFNPTQPRVEAHTLARVLTSRAQVSLRTTQIAYPVSGTWRALQDTTSPSASTTSAFRAQ